MGLGETPSAAWVRDSSIDLHEQTRLGKEGNAKTYHPSSTSRVLRRLGFSRQKARPFHPKKDPEARAAFKKGGLPTR